MSRTIVDRRLAKTLRRIRHVVHTHYSDITVRSMRPGPNLLRHSSVGLLAAEAARAWIDKDETPLMLPLIADELHRRGFEESVQALLDDRDSEPVEEIDQIFQAETSAETKLEMVAAETDQFAAAVDEFDPRPLSHREVIDDLTIMNAAPEAVDAYVAALGASDVAPSEVLAAELESGGQELVANSPTVSAEKDNELTL